MVSDMNIMLRRFQRTNQKKYTDEKIDDYPLLFV
jgi:hypothetical protein